MMIYWSEKAVEQMMAASKDEKQAGAYWVGLPRRKDKK